MPLGVSHFLFVGGAYVDGDVALAVRGTGGN